MKAQEKCRKDIRIIQSSIIRVRVTSSEFAESWDQKEQKIKACNIADI